MSHITPTLFFHHYGYGVYNERYSEYSNIRTSDSVYPVYTASINYANIRDGFVEWIRGRVSREVARDYVSSLDRHVAGRIIRSPADIIEILNNAERGRDRLTKAIRNLINYCVEMEMIREEFAIKLKKAIKTQYSGVDLYVPTDEEVRKWLAKIDKEDARTAMLLIIFGGLRIKEAVRILEKFDRARLKFEKISGVEIAYYELGWKRRTKIANYAFMPGWLGRKLRRFETSYYRVQTYAVNRGVKMKYLRKWFINKLVELEVPESVVRFIIGHSQRKNIMGLHYLDLLRQAKKYYAKAVRDIEASVLMYSEAE